MKKSYPLQSSIVNSSGVNKASTCLWQGCQGLPGPRCPLCLCQSPRVLDWVLLFLAGWSRSSFPAGKGKHPSEEEEGTTTPSPFTLQINKFRSAPIPGESSFYGALFTMQNLPHAPALHPSSRNMWFYRWCCRTWCKFWSNSFVLWPLETLGFLGYFTDCCILENQMSYKVIQCR